MLSKSVDSQEREAHFLRIAGTLSNMKYARLGAVLVLAASLASGGCNKGGGKGKLHPVEVTLLSKDGKPLKDIRVNFVPVVEGDPAASGTTDADGHCKLNSSQGEGAVAGKYKVVLMPEMSKDMYMKKSSGSSAGQPGGAAPFEANRDIPKKYMSKATTTEEIEVTADGDNKFEIKIKP
jgi:hypothetical protein